jgi:hypothetical protein
LFRSVMPLVLILILTGQAVGQLDFEREPINYSHSEPTDPVSRLAKDVSSGKRTLAWEDGHGYLKAVLQALEISPTSQTLVFSKTSLQVSRISPQTPRAVYFNDDVYVGWIPNADVIEISAADPRLGGTFYTLPQKRESVPVIHRETAKCLSCHASTHTRRVPGHIVRSVYPATNGLPVYRLGTHINTDSSPWHERWGGWYVSGTYGDQRHMGNAVVEDAEQDRPLDTEAGANLTDLRPRFRTERYLTPHSDVVALMVLQHQAWVHNVLTAANHSGRLTERDAQLMNKLLERPADFESEATISRYQHAADKVVRALLFDGEEPLSHPVVGTSGFAEEFSSRGPADAKGRRLRELNLQRRLMQYPCSFLIYSESFRQLPQGVRNRVLVSLQSVLTSADTRDEFDHLSAADRQAIDEILTETHPEYPVRGALQSKN